MSAISITGLEPELEEWLSRRAASHGVSLAEEVQAILREEKAREAPSRPLDEAARRAAWDSLFAAAYKPPPGAPDSTDLIREDRDSR